MTAEIRYVLQPSGDFLKIFSNDNVIRETKINGKRTWIKNGEIHNVEESPAVMYDNTEEYWTEGKLVKIIRKDTSYQTTQTKSFEYFKNNLVHRDETHNDMRLPAMFSEGDRKYQMWYTNGWLDRDNGLPAVICWDVKVWYRKGEKFRENGLPTVVYRNGETDEIWYDESGMLQHKNI